MMETCCWPGTMSKFEIFERPKHYLQRHIRLTYRRNNDTKCHRNQCTSVPVRSAEITYYYITALKRFERPPFYSKRCMTAPRSLYIISHNYVQNGGKNLYCKRCTSFPAKSAQKRVIDRYRDKQTGILSLGIWNFFMIYWPQNKYL